MICVVIAENRTRQLASVESLPRLKFICVKLDFVFSDCARDAKVLLSRLNKF